jgi:hypothetical protein
MEEDTNKPTLPSFPSRTESPSLRSKRPNSQSTIQQQTLVASCQPAPEFSQENNYATFPQKMRQILSNPSYSDSITWLPHGRGFVILQKRRFAEEVMPKFFNCKFTSFTRKLNRWNFTRVTRGPEVGAYYHQLFQRDNPDLAKEMTCIGSDSKQQIMPFDPIALGLAQEAYEGTHSIEQGPIRPQLCEPQHIQAEACQKQGPLEFDNASGTVAGEYLQRQLKIEQGSPMFEDSRIPQKNIIQIETSSPDVQDQILRQCLHLQQQHQQDDLNQSHQLNQREYEPYQEPVTTMALMKGYSETFFHGASAPTTGSSPVRHDRLLPNKSLDSSRSTLGWMDLSVRTSAAKLCDPTMLKGMNPTYQENEDQDQGSFYQSTDYGNLSDNPEKYHLPLTVGDAQQLTVGHEQQLQLQQQFQLLQSLQEKCPPHQRNQPYQPYQLYQPNETHQQQQQHSTNSESDTFLRK